MTDVQTNLAGTAVTPASDSNDTQSNKSNKALYIKWGVFVLLIAACIYIAYPLVVGKSKAAEKGADGDDDGDDGEDEPANSDSGTRKTANGVTGSASSFDLHNEVKRLEKKQAEILKGISEVM